MEPGTKLGPYEIAEPLGGASKKPYSVSSLDNISNGPNFIERDN